LKKKTEGERPALNYEKKGILRGTKVGPSWNKPGGKSRCLVTIPQEKLGEGKGSSRQVRDERSTSSDYVRGMSECGHNSYESGTRFEVLDLSKKRKEKWTLYVDVDTEKEDKVSPKIPAQRECLERGGEGTRIVSVATVGRGKNW